MSSTTTAVKSKDRTTSSAGQKFWPLKKFGLHHGKTDDQPIALSTTAKSAIVNEPVKGNNKKTIKILCDTLLT